MIPAIPAGISFLINAKYTPFVIDFPNLSSPHCVVSGEKADINHTGKNHRIGPTIINPSANNAPFYAFFVSFAGKNLYAPPVRLLTLKNCLQNIIINQIANNQT